MVTRRSARRYSNLYIGFAISIGSLCQPCALGKHFSDLFVPEDPLCPPAISQMHSWLDKCNAEHSECKVEKSSLPARVLDLGSRSEREAMIRLVEPVGQLDHYVALSHIWGKSITFLTTRNTFAAKKRGFNLHETLQPFVTPS